MLIKYSKVYPTEQGWAFLFPLGEKKAQTKPEKKRLGKNWKKHNDSGDNIYHDIYPQISTYLYNQSLEKDSRLP